MKRTQPAARHILTLLTFVCVLWVAPSASAQDQPMPSAQGQPSVQQTPGLPGSPQDRDSDITWRELAGFDRFLDSHPELSEQLRKDPLLINNEEFVGNHPELQQYLQQHPEIRQELQQDPSAFMRQEGRFDRREEHRELARMDDFLDSHPKIAAQLQKDPSLINNEEFVESHPELQQFLQQHPEIRQELQQNPNAFMRQEQRFDNREEHREMTRMDQFLDAHPEIAEQLRKNPSLVDNQDFVAHHPALQEFLQTHGEIRQELQQNPSAFMQAQERFDQNEKFRDDRGLNRIELANMDRFLDSHPEIAEQLRKNPALVNDKEFVDKHPALKEFLAQHQGVRDEFKENPVAFMQAEEKFDRSEPGGMRRDRDDARGQLVSFNEFLEGHRQIAGELSKNPSLAKNEEYIQSHPELQLYLKTHAQVREELNQNPQLFVQSAQQLTASSTTTHQEKSPKALPNPK